MDDRISAMSDPHEPQPAAASESASAAASGSVRPHTLTQQRSGGPNHIRALRIALLAHIELYDVLVRGCSGRAAGAAVRCH